MYENITLDSRLVILLELQKVEEHKKYSRQYRSMFEDLISLYEDKEWLLAKEKIEELREHVEQKNEKITQMGYTDYYDYSIDVIEEEI